MIPFFQSGPAISAYVIQHMAIFVFYNTICVPLYHISKVDIQASILNNTYLYDMQLVLMNVVISIWDSLVAI